MPYSKIDELPEAVQKLPESKQRQWMTVFNSAYAKAVKDGKEEKEAESSAFAQANGVVKATDYMFVRLSDDLSEIKLLYPGKFKHGLFGEFDVDKKDIEQAVKNFNDGIALRGDNELPLNYNHASYDKNPDNAKAAGWIQKLFLKGSELWAKVNFTEKAKEFIQAKEFKYISPEFHKNWTDENGEPHGFTILGAALTNVNFLKKNMPALALTELDNGDYIGLAELETFLKRTPEKDALFRATSGLYHLETLMRNKIQLGDITSINDLKTFYNNQNQDLLSEMERIYTESKSNIDNEVSEFTDIEADKNLDSNKQKSKTEKGVHIMELTAQLIEVLNLNDGDDVLNAVKSIVTKNSELEKVNQDLQNNVKKLTDQSSDSKNQIKELTEKVTMLDNKLSMSDAQKAIEGFIFNEKTNKGKLFPKHREFWVKLYLNDPEGTVKQLEDMPDVIDFNSQGSSGDAAKKADDPSVEVDRLTKEKMKADGLKYNEAMKIVLTDNPELAKEYREANYYGE